MRENLSDRVIVYLTEQCNRFCAPCALGIRPKKNPRHLDAKDLAAALKELEPHRPIYLTGGEPTLHPRFNAIARLLKRFDSATVITNGHWITTKERAARELRKIPRNVVIRLSVNRYLEERDPRLKEKARILGEVAGEAGREWEYCVTTAKKKNGKWVDDPAEGERIVKEYGLPEEKVRMAGFQEPGEMGTAPSVSISWTGDVFSSQHEMYEHERFKRGEPLGHLREGIRKVLER